MRTKTIICAAAALASAACSAAGLRRLPAVTVAEGASLDVSTENALSLKSSNTAIASVSLPNAGTSIVSGLKLGTVEIVFNDKQGPFATKQVTVVPSYWETLEKFFGDDPEVSVSVSGDKVIVSGRTSSHETIRRVEQSKAFDPERIISQVTYSAPAVGTILQSYLHHVGYSNVTVTAVGNEVCLAGRLFDRQEIANVQKRATDFLAEFPGIGVNVDGLRVFNQRIVLDVEMIQYDVTQAENLGIEWPTAISAEGNFSYGWDMSRNASERSDQSRKSSYSDSTDTENSYRNQIGGGKKQGGDKSAQNGEGGDGEGETIVDSIARKTADALSGGLNGSSDVTRGNNWRMASGVTVDGVRMTVNLLKRNGAAKTLYKTSLATQSGEEAKFQNGGTIHRNTQGTFSSGDLKEIEYGFIIKALPKIVDEHMVSLVVDMDNKQPINYSSGNVGGTQDIDVARYQTRSQYMVRPGETILVSGFNRIDERDTKQGLPWLCKIPFIGERLFGSTVTSDKTTEIVLVVTVNWAIEGSSEAAEKRRDELRERKTEVEMP